MLWSNPATWGGTLPIAGDTVVIGAGTSIVLDVVTPALGMVTIASGGTLTIQATGTVGMTAASILVSGSLLYGSAGALASNPVNITLTGIDPVWPARSDTPSIKDNGSGMYRTIMVMSGGVVDLRGAAPATIWTSLNANATSGATALTTAVATGWASGDEVAVSPSGYWLATARTEKRTLTGAASGTSLALSSGIGYDRWGALQYPIDVPQGTFGVSLTQGPFTNAYPPSIGNAGTPTVIDERSIVVNLTRNLKINGANDSAWATDGNGLHMMCMPGGFMYVEGAEIDRCGQDGRLGKYPLHWHMLSYTPATLSRFTTALGNAATFLTTTTFSLAGDQTAAFTAGSYVEYTVTGGEGVAKVASAAFAAGVTTVTITGGSQALDASLSVVFTFIGGGALTGASTAGQGATNCVIKNSKLRAIVVHGTNGLALTNNVAHNIAGWAYFLEEHGEENNVFTGNVALSVNEPTPAKRIKAFDAYNQQTSGSGGFWITNMANTFNNNVTADCQGPGLWHAAALRCFGLSTNVAIKPLFTHPGTNTHSGWFVFSNAGPNLQTLGGSIDDLGNVYTGMNYNPTADGQLPVQQGGVSPALQFTISGVRTHHAGLQGYVNVVGIARYLNWTSSSQPEVHAIGQVVDGTIFDTWLPVGTTLNNVGSPANNTATTKHAFVSYHRSGNDVNTVFVNFPFGGRETIVDAPGNRNELYKGSGAVRSEDLYLDPLSTGIVRNTGSRFINSHPGFRGQSPQIDGRVISAFGTDPRSWVTAGAELDPYGYWGNGAGVWLLQDSPFLTYGAANLTAVQPTGQNQGYSTTDQMYGFIPTACDSLTHGSTTSKDQSLQSPGPPILFEQLDTANTTQGSWVCKTLDAASRFGFRHATLRKGGRYKVTFPGSDPLSVYGGFVLTGFYRSTDTLVIGIRWSGSVPARVAFKYGGAFNPTSLTTDISGGYAAAADAVAYSANAVASMSALVATTGKPLAMWQDTANAITWVKITGGFFTQDPTVTTALSTDPNGNLAYWRYHCLNIYPAP